MSLFIWTTMIAVGAALLGMPVLIVSELLAQRRERCADEAPSDEHADDVADEPAGETADELADETADDRV